MVVNQRTLPPRLCRGFPHGLGEDCSPALTLLLLIFVLLAFPAKGLGQTAPAYLIGTTADVAKTPVPDTKVSVTNEATGLERSAISDKSGRFILPLLPPGVYTLTAEKPGSPRVRMINLSLSPGATVRVTVQFAPTTSVRGKVVDFKTGEPVAKALISIRSQGISAMSDDAGAFELTAVEPGDLEVYVSTVGYGLLKTRLQVQAGEIMEVELLLGQEALKHTERLTIASNPFDPTEPSAATENTLQPTDLKNLSSMFGDPFRSVQSLPGIYATTDTYSQFAYRGAGTEDIAFYIDGVPLRVPFHAVRQLTELGSTSLLNGDVIESISLLGDGFPAKYGDSTAAVVNVRTRDPGYDRMSVRINMDLFQSGITAEGPLGSKKKLTWMVAARKSYLEYLMAGLDTSRIALGYYDVAGKLVWKPSPGHRLSLLAIHGPGTMTNRNFGYAKLYARDRPDMLDLSWQWTPRYAVLRTNVNSSLENARNDIGLDNLLEWRQSDNSIRHDATVQLSSHLSVNGGFEFSRTQQNYLSHYHWETATAGPVATALPVAQFQQSASRLSEYFQPTWSAAQGRIVLSGGIRSESFSFTGENVLLPRASLAVRLASRLKFFAGYGQYAQFPELVQLLGDYCGPSLAAQRSRGYTAGLEYQPSERVRFRVEAYDRYEQGKPYSPETEWRLVNGQIVAPSPGPVLRNSVQGYSRGIEVLLQRSSANRFSGWVSYALGYARYRDILDHLEFDGDYDQRHTLSLFGSYRLNQTLNLSGKYRYGSNFPVVGFFQGDPYGENVFQFSNERNRLRIPPYSRLDLRITKVYNHERFRTSVWAEVDNLLNHDNWAYFGVRLYLPGATDFTMRRGEMLPVFPSVGLTIEF